MAKVRHWHALGMSPSAAVELEDDAFKCNRWVRSFHRAIKALVEQLSLRYCESQ
jgi:hypothetical protein